MSRVKIDLEYIFKASPTILYNFLTTPAYLVRWFCDEVDILGETYTFVWQGYEQEAKLISDVEDKYLKFEWIEPDYEGEYLEYKITVSPVTNETILTISDFCDDDEKASQRQLWDSQIKQMKTEMGV